MTLLLSISGDDSSILLCCVLLYSGQGHLLIGGVVHWWVLPVVFILFV